MSLVSFQSYEPFHAYKVQPVPFEHNSLSLRLPLRPYGSPPTPRTSLPLQLGCCYVFLCPFPHRGSHLQ